jgi:Arc/MetJ-type ribon-helix-helix transcriptional regulator
MKNIKSFEQYIKEELTHGYDTDTGGSSLLSGIGDEVGGFFGRVFKNKSDIMRGILDELLKDENEEDIEFIKSQVNRNITQGQIKGKSEDEIREIVSKEIEDIKKFSAHLLSK